MRRVVLTALLLLAAGSAAAQPCGEFSRVSPGDPIRAVHMNQIFECLEWLASRVDDDDDDGGGNGVGGEIPEAWLGDWHGLFLVETLNRQRYTGPHGVMWMTITPSSITWRAEHQYFQGSGTARLTAAANPPLHGMRLIGWQCEVEVGLVTGAKLGQTGLLTLLAMTTAPGCAVSWDAVATLNFQRQQ